MARRARGFTSQTFTQKDLSALLADDEAERSRGPSEDRAADALGDGERQCRRLPQPTHAPTSMGHSRLYRVASGDGADSEQLLAGGGTRASAALPRGARFTTQQGKPLPSDRILYDTPGGSRLTPSCRRGRCSMPQPSTRIFTRSTCLPRPNRTIVPAGEHAVPAAPDSSTTL